MSPFWKDSPVVGSEWLIFCLATSALAIPIIYFSCVHKDEFWKLFGGFVFLNYVIGYFVVIVIFLGIGSNLLQITNILSKEYFNLDRYGSFWDKYLLCGYVIWYLLSLVFTIKMGRQGDS
ncbi:MAG: hypothetical protein GF353_01580 [Candidatus Lokiarchaeota archaeon]|nr:hypothetical protein [Candidatus Lokiarchaeota archaeon]